MTPDKTVVDWPALQHRYPARPELIEQLTRLFLTRHGLHVEELRLLAARGDIAGIEKLAHDIKGSAASVAAVELEALAAQAMAQAWQRDPACVEAARGMATALQRALDAIQAGRTQGAST